MEKSSQPVDKNVEFQENLDSIQKKIEELKSEKKLIISEIENNLKSWCKKWFSILFGGLSIIGIISFIIMFVKINTFITDSITKKFAEPSIKQTLTEVAQNKAGEIIIEKLNPEISNAKVTISNDINSFSLTLKEFERKYGSQLSKLNEEYLYINHRNQV